MKVLHLLASNKYSGAENVVCTIIDKFNGEIEMAYCSPFGDIEKTLKERNITYYGLNKMDNKNLKVVIKKYNPDIIHAHDYRASVLAAMSGFKGKIISHLHINAEFSKSWNCKTILYNIVVNKFYKVIGVSDAVYNEAIFKNKINKKYETIYNYVDRKRIIKKSEEYKYDNTYDLFFIGRLNKLKAPIDFVEIVNQLHLKGNKVTAVMIGDGELKDECKELINKYKLNDFVDMQGFVSNPFPIIKNCKVGIMPSKVEGFGLTAIESLILDKPVLNSGVGGLGEIFVFNKQYICNSINEYVDNVVLLLKNKKQDDFKNILSEYCDEKSWHDKLLNIYREEK